MAGFLFEFAMPGLRRNGSIQHGYPRAIGSSTRYDNIKNMFQRMQKMYQKPEFEQYVQKFHDTPFSHHEKSKWPMYMPPIAFPQNEIVSPKDIPFVALCPEYRYSYHIFEWMHKGSNSWLIGNIRRRRAAHLWILASDEERRNCLLSNMRKTKGLEEQLESAAILSEATQLAYGQDYPMRVQKRLKHLMWLCEQSFHADSKKSKKQPKLDKARTFTMDQEEARYLVDLYDLPRRIDALKKERGQ